MPELASPFSPLEWTYQESALVIYTKREFFVCAYRLTYDEFLSVIRSIESQIFFSQNLVFIVFSIMEKNSERIQIGFSF